LIGAIAIEGKLFAQIDYYVRFRVARTANIRIAVIASQCGHYMNFNNIYYYARDKRTRIRPYGYDVTIYRGKLLVTVSMVIKISGHTRACAVIRAYLCNTPE